MRASIKIRLIVAASVLLSAFAPPLLAANGLYDKARESFLSQSPALSWSADTIKVALVRGYTPSLSTHQFLSDVTGSGGGTIVSTSAALTNKTVASGVADADDIVFSAVPNGAPCPYLVIYKDTGNAATSPLIALIDSAVGLPFQPNGGDLFISWSNTSVRIFKL